jgi:hypothetical protein
MSKLLINRSHVREYALAVLAEKRPALKEKMTRVSGEFFVKLDTQLRNYVQAHIESMPSVGKTIK